ncbi:hepatoma-derived growth factor-related protein 2-like [Ctenocephalides felis]|uniref:hepatoma-derived growth factor-related protein 2-like n=1 Tax=Ctenocephalides felis TaxID=7515 RepID=UPI000E6E5540|nr:hepatoma-derived growth factor-related protein 2-like [Ctenocephalides felis]
MSKQSKKAVEYKLNDLVFARVRGYPPWPARIVETGLKYKVIFYGTAETGYIKIEDLFNYEENRESFKKKFAKRKNYQLSLNEITVAWNRRQVLQDFLPKSNSVLDTDVKDVKETKVIENKKQIAQREDAIKPIKPDQIHQLSNAKNSLKKEEEPKPSTSQSNNKKRTRTDSESSVPSKRPKVQHLRDLLDDSYLQGTILKFERKGILYTMYSIAELQKIKAKHEEILSMKENDNFNADTYEFICDYSVALVYEPIIHPVVFGLHITKHRPDEFDGPLARLEWESGMIQDVNHIILDLSMF